MQKLFEVPTNCPCCNSKLIRQGVHVVCKNKNCKDQILDKIVYWVHNCEMDLVSGGTIETLFDAGKINSIIDLYDLKEDDLKNIPGIGESKKKNIVNQINKSKTITTHKFLNGLSIYSVGIKALKNLGIKTIEDFLNFNDPKYEVGKKIIEWKKDSDNILFFNKLWSKLIIVDTKSNSIATKGTVCFTGTDPTGTGRKELIKLAEKNSYEFHDSVSKDLTILVCADPKDNSSKLKKAQKLNVKIISYEDFHKLVK